MTRQRLTAEEKKRREAEIVRMRRAKISFTAIGERFDISDVMAGKIYREALAKNPLSAIQIDEHRLEELELVELATRQLMQLALDTAQINGRDKVTPRTRVEAWSAVRAWAERKAKLLGLDAPTRHEVLTIDAIDAQIAALRHEMATAPELQVPAADDQAS